MHPWTYAMNRTYIYIYIYRVGKKRISKRVILKTYLHEWTLQWGNILAIEEVQSLWDLKYVHYGKEILKTKASRTSLT